MFDFKLAFTVEPFFPITSTNRSARGRSSSGSSRYITSLGANAPEEIRLLSKGHMPVSLKLLVMKERKSVS